MNEYGSIFARATGVIRTVKLLSIMSLGLLLTGCPLEGDNGQAGAAGSQGTQGAQGPIGPAGAAGPAGPAGSQGAQGDAGPAGPQGAQGMPGAEGPSGVVATYLLGGWIRNAHFTSNERSFGLGSGATLDGPATIDVIIEDGQMLTVSATMTLLQSQVSSNYIYQGGPCFARHTDTGVTPIVENLAPAQRYQNQGNTLVNQTLPGSAAAILTAGTYTIGMCLYGDPFNNGQGYQFGNARVVGFVQVINQ